MFKHFAKNVQTCNNMFKHENFIDESSVVEGKRMFKHVRKNWKLKTRHFESFFSQNTSWLPHFRIFFSCSSRWEKTHIKFSGVAKDTCFLKIDVEGSSFSKIVIFTACLNIFVHVQSFFSTVWTFISHDQYRVLVIFFECLNIFHMFKHFFQLFRHFIWDVQTFFA